MTIIAPSLLACDFLNIEQTLIALSNEKNIWLHLDVMDGHFVPNLTFGTPIIEMIAKKTKIPLDAHFMVTNPKFHADALKNVGLHNFTFHFESVTNHLEMIQYLKSTYKSVGISIKPKTSDLDLSDDILKLVDLVLVMSVEPGFGGQKFMPDSIDKIKRLHQRKLKNNLKFQIQVDGGISNSNSKELILSGANNLVAGSYIFKDGPLKFHQNILSLL